MRLIRSPYLAILSAIWLTWTASILPASAQTEATTEVPEALTLNTPYVGVRVQPDESATFTLDVGAPPGTRVALEVDSLPTDWSARLQGGGFVVDEVLVPATGHVELTLDVDVPATVEEGDYEFAVTATAGGDTARLDLSVGVAVDAGGGVVLDTDFPALQGPPDSTYSFNLTLDNGSPQDIEFGLSAEAAPGWAVEVRPNSEARASTVTVEGGRSAALTVEVDPPDTAEGGVYPIVVRADGAGQTVTAELIVEITGTFGLEMTTTSGVLNTEVSAGSTTSVEIALTNTGTAPLVGIDLNAVPPRGWEASFDREMIETLPPGESVVVVATVTPAEDAINGDYVVSFSASVAETRADMDVRTTVTTSEVWGLVGIGVILAALVGLSLVFRTYGRR